MGDVQDGVKAVKFHARFCFFERFPDGRLGSGLAVLHEARRECPEAITGFDGPPAQQDSILPGRNGTRHDAWVDVVNGAAVVAHVAFPVVTFRYPELHACPAAAAVLHACLPENESPPVYGRPAPLVDAVAIAASCIIS